MALATKDPDNDEKLNPGSWNESTGSRLSAAEQAALSDIENNFDQDADSSAEDANIQRARDGEEGGNKLIPKVKEPTDEAVKTKGRREAEKDERGKRRDKMALNFMKKKGPMALIGLLIAGGGALFTALLTPGLALVQLKEALMEDLNDSVAAMDVRSQHIFRAKMKQQVSGVCTKKVSVRCKYQSMSKTQLKKMAKAGFEVEVSPERRSLTSGRYNVKSITYIDGVKENGEPNKVKVTPENFKERYRNNPAFRSHMNKYYSARWMSVNGPDMDSVKSKFKLSFSRLINGKNKKEMKDQVTRNVAEGTVTDRDGRKVTVETRKVDESGNPSEDGQERKVYVKEDGTVLKNDTTGKIVDPEAEETKINKLRQLADTGTGKMLTTGLKAANIYTGTQEVVCSITSLLRMAGIAGRTLKFEQAMRYALPFLNTADAIKGGAATVEATSFTNDILTDVDTRDFVLTDASLPTEEDSAGKKVISGIAGDQPAAIVPQENPNKGKDALDAPLAQAAMHGSTPDIGLRESLASLSGAMGSTMVALADEIQSLPLAPGEGTCAFWKNPIVQGAGFILSVATIAVSCLGGCAGAVVSVAKAAATTAIAMFITVWVSNQIQDLVESKTFTGDTTGYDAGGGIGTGTAAITSVAASSKGMTPISSPEEIAEKDLVAANYKLQDAEVQRLEAAGTPLDVYNQYSFLGSIAWSLAPIARDSSDTIASLVVAPLKLLGSVPSWFAPSASAVVASSPERYTKCDDEVYKRINLNSADMMCNLRWNLSDAQLNADPEKVVQWMVDSCQIDSETGELNPTGVCDPADDGNRATSQAEALSMLNSSSDEIAAVMKYDDEGVDQPIADSQESTVATRAAVLPSSIDDEVNPPADAKAAEEDVRTYAHFLRYCRYGPGEGAREVNFGDPDGPEGNVLTGLDFDAAYSSVGKECLTENNCEGDIDPNTAFQGDFSQEALWFCRPPQYDIYAVYTMDNIIEQGMDQEGTSSEGSNGDVASSGEFGWPMKGDGMQITSCYGPRWGSLHAALDIAAPDGNNPEVIASDAGEVVTVSNDDQGLSGFGNSVVIKHDNGYYTRYSHMDNGSVVVKKGDKVEKGAKLGIQGTTGQSTGPHLDFGMGKENPPLNNAQAENPLNHMEIPSGVTNQAGCKRD